jgi:hypothetical protein
MHVNFKENIIYGLKQDCGDFPTGVYFYKTFRLSLNYISSVLGRSVKF